MFDAGMKSSWPPFVALGPGVAMVLSVAVAADVLCLLVAAIATAGLRGAAASGTECGGAAGVRTGPRTGRVPPVYPSDSGASDYQPPGAAPPPRAWRLRRRPIPPPGRRRSHVRHALTGRAHADAGSSGRGAPDRLVTWPRARRAG
ncbi:hypothetical protein GCM10010521_70820 [Streptomyces rameus]|uniref:Uncharacterized protein n=1 Tax=Streptomyces rameus TaxID=68261 RepID=A0ABP6HN03_9ACTN